MDERIRKITRAVRRADKAFEAVGGSSGHWVRDCFLPYLEDEGLRVVEVESLPQRREIMTGIDIIAKERIRQVQEERWDAAHDDQHIEEELAWAAACYAAPEEILGLQWIDRFHKKEKCWVYPWPWEPYWWKKDKHARIKQLAIAGALIAAEIERLMRTDKDGEETLE